MRLERLQGLVDKAEAWPPRWGNGEPWKVPGRGGRSQRREEASPSSVGGWHVPTAPCSAQLPSVRFIMSPLQLLT